MTDIYKSPRHSRGRIRYRWDDALPPLTTTDVTKAIGLWTVIVLVSGGTSAFLGLLFAANAAGAISISVGLGTVVLVYVLATVSPWGRRLIRLPFVRTTAYVGYGTRIALTLLIWTGFAAFPDMLVGMAVGNLLSIVIGEDLLNVSSTGPWVLLSLDWLKSFIVIYAWTILVAFVWNVLLGAYMLIIYGLQRLFRKMPTGRPGEVCAACGYDVHMSTGQCPECGEPIPDRIATATTPSPV
ncbi:MAG: hypothetical protein AAGB29_12985 [Planctomycetota bacterium]